LHNKKFLLTLSLFFFSIPSHAEWIYISETTVSEMYVDFKRIRKRDGFVYFWFMLNIKDKTEKFGSSREYNKGDCNAFRLKNLQVDYYKGQMTKGGLLIRDDRESKWNYPAPGSGYEKALQLVCQ